MISATVAILWIGVSVAAGITASIGFITRARTLQAKAIGDHETHYRQMAEKSTAAQEHLATAITELNKSIATLGTLLREVPN